MTDDSLPRTPNHSNMSPVSLKWPNKHQSNYHQMVSLFLTNPETNFLKVVRCEYDADTEDDIYFLLRKTRKRKCSRCSDNGSYDFKFTWGQFWESFYFFITTPRLHRMLVHKIYLIESKNITFFQKCLNSK